ncbi:hypothetical protein HDV05_007736 [Chytridiales sp. JEL 0842]|nr:hypothetical protein HDV05_007736 [Chytridiales sp. JEL 0842]
MTNIIPLPTLSHTTIEQILAINTHLIKILAEYQNNGWLEEPEYKIYQQRLQTNLTYLATAADFAGKPDFAKLNSLASQVDINPVQYPLRLAHLAPRVPAPASQGQMVQPEGQGRQRTVGRPPKSMPPPRGQQSQQAPPGGMFGMQGMQQGQMMARPPGPGMIPGFSPQSMLPGGMLGGVMQQQPVPGNAPLGAHAVVPGFLGDQPGAAPNTGVGAQEPNAILAPSAGKHKLDDAPDAEGPDPKKPVLASGDSVSVPTTGSTPTSATAPQAPPALPVSTATPQQQIPAAIVPPAMTIDPNPDKSDIDPSSYKPVAPFVIPATPIINAMPANLTDSSAPSSLQSVPTSTPSDPSTTTTNTSTNVTTPTTTLFPTSAHPALNPITLIPPNKAMEIVEQRLGIQKSTNPSVPTTTSVPQPTNTTMQTTTNPATITAMAQGPTTQVPPVIQNPPPTNTTAPTPPPTTRNIDISNEPLKSNLEDSITNAQSHVSNTANVLLNLAAPPTLSSAQISNPTESKAAGNTDAQKSIDLAGIDFGEAAHPPAQEPTSASANVELDSSLNIDDFLADLGSGFGEAQAGDGGDQMGGDVEMGEVGQGSGGGQQELELGPNRVEESRGKQGLEGEYGITTTNEGEQRECGDDGGENPEGVDDDTEEYEEDAELLDDGEDDEQRASKTQMMVDLSQTTGLFEDGMLGVGGEFGDEEEEEDGEYLPENNDGEEDDFWAGGKGDG